MISAGCAIDGIIAKPAAAHDLPLNRFQQTMLFWEQVHPYNAGHAVRLCGPADVPSLQEAVRDVCRQSGLGLMRVDPVGCRCSYEPTDDIALDEISAAGDVDQALADLFRRQLNERFPPEPHHPIRWTVLREAADAAHWLVLVYHHVAADASAIELLISAVLKRYFQQGSLSDPLPQVWMDGAAEYLSQPVVRSELIRAWINMGHLHRRLKLAFRMPDDPQCDDQTAVHVRSARPDLWPALASACRARGVGVNDACMAALAVALAQRTPRRQQAWLRKRLPIATIASGRRDWPELLSNLFSVCLIDWVVCVDHPDAGVFKVLDAIAANTRSLKASPAAADAMSAVRLFFIRRLWSLLGIKNRRQSYSRSFPVAGGVSTMVVHSERFAGLKEKITRYVRVGPPGPAVPIVLSPTVYDGRLEICIVHRLATMQPEAAKDLAGGVIEQLEHIAAGEQP